jgi:hypothetical protein
VASAVGCGSGYGSHTDSGGSIITGDQGCDSSDAGGYDPGSGPYVPSGPPPPAYEDYWTPACMINGPPGDGGVGGGDVMCNGAATICDTRGQKDAIFMRHYRRLVGDPKANWELVGTECRGPDEPTKAQPKVTQEMVLDQAYAAAPHPTAEVQPGNRTFVNVPNNYWADAADKTMTVNVLGHPIAVRFTVNDVSWDFGDGTPAGHGAGVENAEVGAAGAVEHAYATQGSYTITATSTVGVRFTLPNGQTVDLPNAFSMPGEPITLPVGEIQTRVDSTS